MRRLTASDALFLYQERSRNDYMHSMRVAVVDMKDRSSLELRDVLVRTFCSLEPFHWRVEPVPFHLHHPLWRVDPEFDVEEHIHRIACPAPGSDAELAELVSDLASTPLNRERPLWECWIVEGLARGRCAFIVKVHHALADGVATGALFEATGVTEPTSLDDLPPLLDYTGEPGLSLASHVRLAAGDTVRHLRHAVPAVAARQRTVRRARAESSTTLKPASFSESPALSLNQSTGSHRRYAFTSFDMADLRELRTAFGATINDLFLATASGAMRAFLLERGELPDVPLIGCVPVSTRTDDERYVTGNRLGTLAVRLRTDLADPAERTAATKVEADAAKAGFRLTAGARPENYVDCLPPALQLLILRAVGGQVAKGKPVLGNLGVSSVRGPKKALYLADFEIDELYGVGPLAGGIGLNITAWSYADRLHVSFLASRDVIADLWPFVGLFREALEDIRESAPLHREQRA